MPEERRQLSVEQAAQMLNQQEEPVEQNPSEQASEPAEQPESPPEPETVSEDKTEDTQPPEKEDEPEEQEVTTLEDLAEYLEVEPSYVLGMKTKIKAGDSEADVTIGDLAKSYRLEGELNKRLSDHGRERKEWEQQQQQRQAELVERAQFVDAMLSKFETQMTGGDIDWAKLRDEDPQEYAARKADVAERREALAKSRSELQQQMIEEQQRHQAQWQQQFQQARQKMWTDVVSAFPDWSVSEDAARNGEDALTGYLMKDLGFTENDLRMVVDPRLIVMGEKARRYDELKGGQSLVKKKLKKAKRVIKPGHAPSKGEKADDNVTALRKTLKRTGNVKDFAALLSAVDRSRGS